MSELLVTSIYNQEGEGAPSFPKGATVTGVITATTFKGGAEISSGIITATSATFSGNVSIGGTLTYEDVTNIDSVGVITARSGIDITGASAGVNGSSNLILKTGGNERLRIDSAGHTLIGTSSWSFPKKFNIQSTTQDILSLSSGETTSGAVDTGVNIEFKIHNGSSLVGMGEMHVLKENGTSGNNASYMMFKTRASGGSTGEKLRIGSAGQFGIAGANYGTSGQVLTSGGASAAPSWNTPAAGAWALLQSASNPNTSTVDFVGLTTAYAAYKVQFIGANINSTNQRTMRCRVYLNGSLVTGSSDYRQQTMYMTYTSSSYNGSGTSRDCIALSGTNQVSKGYNGELTFPMKLRTSGGAESLQAYYGTVVSQSYTNFVSGFMENSFSSLLTGIQFDSPDNYNVTDGQFYLYGLTRT